MDLWSTFKRGRVILFSIIAVISLAWAILLSVYLSMKWPMFMKMQRGILLGLISMSGITALLLYLMMIAGFIYRWEVVRTLFLFGLHIAGAVLLTTMSSEFPCSTTAEGCYAVHLVAVVGSWTLTGLLALYSFFLPVIPYIPCPDSKSYREVTTSHDRRISKLSVDSTKTLIDEEKMVGGNMYLQGPGIAATVQVSASNSLRPHPSFKSADSVWSTATGNTTSSLKSPTVPAFTPTSVSSPTTSTVPSIASRVHFQIPPRPTVGLPSGPAARSRPVQPPMLPRVPPRSTSIHTSQPARYNESQMPPMPGPVVNRNPYMQPQRPPNPVLPLYRTPTAPPGIIENYASVRTRALVGPNTGASFSPPRDIPARSATVGTSQPYAFRRDMYVPPLPAAQPYPSRSSPVPTTPYYQGTERRTGNTFVTAGPADIQRFRSAPDQASYSDTESVRRVPRANAAALGERRSAPRSITVADPATWQKLVLDAANGKT